MSGHRYLKRLSDAVNEHDIEAVVACFDANYSNETPAHPGRGFQGRDQVRKNWSQLFDGIPDLHASVLRVAGDENALWSEWEMSGTRTDGSQHLMRGVIIFGLEDGRATWARFFMEPVDSSEGGVDEAIMKIVGPEVA